ncbi:hypothetical protein ACE7GA_26345 [Roseomonas sp. CCTCC AB2023176]|uniref:hypothetical protein n=1 Tax=Roseomonas sp. CCTCC AB2023176 TaxID=3342640 RepID=UPI0035D619AF
MRVWRGLFRLWVVATCLWVLVAGTMTWVDERGITPAEQWWVLPSAERGVYRLELASDAQALRATHDRIDYAHNIHLIVPKETPQEDMRRYSPTFVRDVVEARGQFLADERWDRLRRSASFILAAPVVVLGLGLASRWVVAGFRRPA